MFASVCADHVRTRSRAVVRESRVPVLQYRSDMSYIAVVRREPTLPRLAQFAEGQWGLVTRREARVAGLSPATITRMIDRGDLERIAHGVFHLRGAPMPDHAELRAAWLQLAPGVPAWERSADQGVVSHRSAAALYGLGHLPADVHEFTLPARRQTRRSDVRLHVRPLASAEWISLAGLPVTRPSRIAADLLADREDNEAIAHVIADAMRGVFDYPGTFADALAPHASRLGLRRGEGLGLLRWLLDLVGDPDAARWLDEAQKTPDRPLAAAAPSMRSSDWSRTGSLR